MLHLLSLDKVYRQFGDVLVMEDVSAKFFCPLVPVSLQPQVFRGLNDIAHPCCFLTGCLLSSSLFGGAWLRR
jgi:hypothetical protein